MTDQPEREMTADEFFKWRDRMRRKHRTMTIAEYQSWQMTGDNLSHPSSTAGFPGGLTIVFSRSYLGKVDD